MGGSTKLSQGWFYLQPVSGSIQAGVVIGGLGTNQFKIQNSKFKIKELLGMRGMRETNTQ
ncbi:hypothetical protein NIES37_54470 [Tolypothrix tenuis PCC 7101]|uniref:Uncharacterized protein n=1 Tax=Tolypothrix tenuis PCC 7101 TaxID=231146 RepID=A0A1Z4N6W7_9CYAN|nr:hypothetical protein NIES37_54470 [Tolypothrix tenuis PCC 7101]BAZ74630.1 hypothetical protein NIES50_32080 [Aulosira laxa NIES-50]